MIATQKKNEPTEEPTEEQPVCIFDEKTPCPIRAYMEFKRKIDAKIKPMLEATDQTMIKGVFSMMEQAIAKTIPSDLGFLHYYCNLCINAPLNRELLKK